MRRDLFLHFLNRDTREIFDLYSVQESVHRRLLGRALNASVALCEDRCIVPPGFLVEDAFAFELAELQREYLTSGVLQFPLRENNLADFAEKKRVGYQPMRSRYSGLFDDTRIGFLGDNATGLIRRKSKVTETILTSWSEGPSGSIKLWSPARKLIVPSALDAVSRIPAMLDAEGTALTWAAISPHIPDEGKPANTELRDVLQNIYFTQYCREFNAIAMTGVPNIMHDFGIPAQRNSYNFRRFSGFCQAFGISEVILEAPAALLTELRVRAGFIALMDAYVGLAEASPSEADLFYAAGRAVERSTFDWRTVRARRAEIFELSPIELAELTDAMSDAAKDMTDTHGLRSRTAATLKIPQEKMIVVTSSEPDFVLFVALEEELTELCKILKFTKHHLAPAATGTINNHAFDVLCPKSMGRVAAAVETANYLASRKTKPKLVIIVGLAGGFAENGSSPGHIVGPRTVVDLAVRKVVDGAQGAAPNFRRRDYPINQSVYNVLTSDHFDQKAWSARVVDAYDWPSDRRPSVHSGPLASVDEVVASDEWRRLILQGTGGESKLLGVEMEAGGVCAACDVGKVPVAMLRVISDGADPSKADDNWRRTGMRTLADLVGQLPMDRVLEAI